MRRLTLLTTVFLMTLTAFHIQAQDTFIMNSDDPPYPCPYTEGAYYQPGVFPRYDASTGNLVLAGADGATVRVLEPINENVRIINWSPDCQYLSAAVGSIDDVTYGRQSPEEWADIYGFDYILWSTRDIVFWDAINGSRVQTIADNPGRYMRRPTVLWSPTGNAALIVGGFHWSDEGSRYMTDFLWRLDTNQVFQLSSEGRPDFNQVFWDYERGQFFVSGWGGVISYDMQNGGTRFIFTRPNDGPTLFIVSEDRSKLVAFTRNSKLDGLAIWDIDTQTSSLINVEFQTPFSENMVALSWDNRYLVLGYDALRFGISKTCPPILRIGFPSIVTADRRR
jgi:hypothetical protein